MNLNEVKKLIATNAVAGVGTERTKINVPDDPSKWDKKSYDLIDDEKISFNKFSVGNYTVFSLKEINIGNRFDDKDYRDLIQKLASDNSIDQSQIVIHSSNGRGYNQFYFKVSNDIYTLTISREPHNIAGRESYDIFFTTERGMIQTNENVPDEVLSVVGHMVAFFAYQKKSAVFNFAGITTGTDNKKKINRRIYVYYMMLRKNGIKSVYSQGKNVFFSLEPIEGLDPITMEDAKKLRGKSEGHLTKKQANKLNDIIKQKDPGHEIPYENLDIENFKKLMNYYTDGQFEKEKREGDINRPYKPVHEYPTLGGSDYNQRMEIFDNISKASDYLEDYVNRIMDGEVEGMYDFVPYDGPQSNNARNKANELGITIDALVDEARAMHEQSRIMGDSGMDDIHDIVIIFEARGPIPFEEIISNSEYSDLWPEWEQTILDNANLDGDEGYHVYEYVFLSDVISQIKRKKGIAEILSRAIK